MISVENALIGNASRPFIVAEMSGNHNRSLETALAIADAAASCGAQALKMQTYTPDTMTLDLSTADFTISDEGSLWRGETLYQLYEKAYTPWEWHRPIFDRCRARGIIGFSTPFDETAVDFLESLDVPCYKVASFEITDLRLLQRIARTGKPVILSTGMASLSELDESVTTLRNNGCKNLVLLKCTSTYPTPPDRSNLLTIPHLRKLFDCEVGLSDHTKGIGAAVAAVALGASVIEKHFTLSRVDGGVDAEFSMEPDELSSLVRESNSAWQALGTISYGMLSEERKSIRFRRSLYVVADMKKGERFSLDNIRSIRPGWGLPPKYFDVLLGKRVTRDVPRGTPLSWDLV
jgi:N-acetylneuraminate synthase